MKNINLLNVSKYKSNMFLTSKTPETSLFFYFIQNWKFYEKFVFSAIEEYVSLYILNKVSFSKYSNEYVICTSVNKKIKTNLLLKKHLKKRKKPVTKVNLNIHL